MDWPMNVVQKPPRLPCTRQTIIHSLFEPVRNLHPFKVKFLGALEIWQLEGMRFDFSLIEDQPNFGDYIKVLQ